MLTLKLNPRSAGLAQGRATAPVRAPVPVSAPALARPATILLLAAAIFAALAAPVASVRASSVDGGAHHAFRKIVLCEYRLIRRTVARAQKQLREQLFDRPFTFAFRNPHAKTPAWEKLNFLSEMSPEELDTDVLTVEEAGSEDPDRHPIQVRTYGFFRGEVIDGIELTFPDADPVTWNYLELTKRELQLEHQALIAAHPLDADEIADLESSVLLGYHSDPDADGVRTFLAVEQEGEFTIRVKLGVDVPCEAVKRYTRETLSEVRRLRTPIATLCRVPVLDFTRAKRL